MGQTSGDDEGAPPVTVDLSPFYMQQLETTKAQWDEVRAWGLSNGYTDLPTGGGKASDHPVYTESWYAIVKWCNARSEREGRMPAYYINNGQTTVYRTGSVDLTSMQVKWSANGYRLPTDAEWEKAARGGVSGKRFPWGRDTISHADANYWANSSTYEYDLNLTNGYHPSYYSFPNKPYTSPVGSFAANGFGLKDMSGNLYEWCWDWHSFRTASTETLSNPRGPATGTGRVVRGGNYDDYPAYVTCSTRGYATPTLPYNGPFIGFRTALGNLVDRSQTITFSLPESINILESIPLVAVASSGLPVSFEVVSGPGTISGNTFTATGIGEITVRASQAGDGQYDAAPNVDLIILLVPNRATVTLLGGQDPVTATDPFGNVVELKVGDTINPGVRVTTPNRTYARILLPDGSTMQIGPKTTLEITYDIENRTIKLHEGFLEIKKTKPKSVNDARLFIRTKTAAIGVRGTTLTVEVTDENGIVTTTTEVLEGVVDHENLLTGEMTELEEGELLSFSGVDPTPARLAKIATLESKIAALKRKLKVYKKQHNKSKIAATNRSIRALNAQLASA